jgi:hypothetical protein
MPCSVNKNKNGSRILLSNFKPQHAFWQFIRVTAEERLVYSTFYCSSKSMQTGDESDKAIAVMVTVSLFLRQ